MDSNFAQPRKIEDLASGRRPRPAIVTKRVPQQEQIEQRERIEEEGRPDRIPEQLAEHAAEDRPDESLESRARKQIDRAALACGGGKLGVLRLEQGALFCGGASMVRAAAGYRAPAEGESTRRSHGDVRWPDGRGPAVLGQVLGPI